MKPKSFCGANKSIEYQELLSQPSHALRRHHRPHSALRRLDLIDRAGPQSTHTTEYRTAVPSQFMTLLQKTRNTREVGVQGRKTKGERDRMIKGNIEQGKLWKSRGEKHEGSQQI